MKPLGKDMAKRPKVVGKLGREPMEEDFIDTQTRPYQRAKGFKKRKKFTLTGVRESFNGEEL